MVLWYVFLLCRLITLCSASQVTNEPPNKVQITAFNSTVFTIVRDEDDDNSFFVGARNHIFRINSSLDIIDSVKNGPAAFVHPSCSKSNANCSHLEGQKNQDNHIILFHKESSGKPTIISCGTLNHGRCSAHGYRNLRSIYTIWTLEEFFMFSEPALIPENSLAMKLPGSVTKEVHTKLESSLQVKNNWKGRFDFVASFHDDRFIYIVSNRKDEDDHSFGYHARIGRICINDTTLNSYREVAAICKISSESESFRYSVATAAHATFRSNLLDELYIAFSSSEGEKDSRICYWDWFTLSLAHQLGCSGNPHPAFNRETSILPEPKSCTDILTEYCSQKSHTPLSYNQISAQFISLIDLKNTTVTSLYIHKNANYSLTLFGTSDGKVAIFKSNYLEETSLVDPSYSSPEERRVKPGAILSADGKFVFFAAADKIARLSTKCSIYTRCIHCTRTLDPLRCRWCGSHCGNAAECPQATKNTCSPIIDSFTSKIWDNKTIINIEGDNFSNTSYLSVSLVGDDEANETCDIQEVDYQRITCVIDGGDERINGSSLRVEVSSSYEELIINGTALSDGKFYLPSSSSQSHFYLSIVLCVILASAFCGLIGLSLYITLLWSRKKSSRMEVVVNSVAMTDLYSNSYIAPMNQQNIDEDILASLRAENRFIPCDCLQKGREVGAGNFGNVFLGQLQLPGESSSRQVAIKSLRDMNTDSLSEFLEEAYKMKDFDHPNVMGLIGICFQGEKPLLVLPYMPNGDLLKFVRDCDKEHKLIDLLKHCLSIAQGMQYLALKKCVHRDLAARNCMLDKNLNAVVADFGLSKDVYETGYYRRPEGKEPPKLPWRWMAPESMQAFTFSLQSDVWSYGVTCWELLTGGAIPYPGVNGCELVEYLKEGKRLLKPYFCPDRVYELWKKCWSHDPRMRPNFTQIIDQLSEFILTEAYELERITVIPDHFYHVPRTKSII